MKRRVSVPIAIAGLLLFAQIMPVIAQTAGAPVDSLLKKYEQALQKNPADEAALSQLHRLLASHVLIPRDEKIRLKQVIKEYTRSAQATLIPEDEPGERIVISGTIRNAAGEPVANALISVFHADAKGLYSPQDAETGRMDEPNARLFGFLRTGVDGRYEFRTVRPGGYPFPIKGLSGNRRWVPAHIHLTVSAEGYRDHKCQSTCQLVFIDDARMTPEWREWANNNGNPILKLARDSKGMMRSVYDIVMLEK